MTPHTSPTSRATSPALRRGVDALAVVSMLVAAALIHGPVFGGHAGYVAALGGLVVGLLVAALTAAARVRAIALTEERELRAWLYTGHAQAADSLEAAVTEAVVGVESRYGVPISVVVVGDMRPGPGELALVAALAEASQNAVRHGAPPVSVYVEVRARVVEAFVKDNGEGFDPATIAADRHGVRDSIVGRMRRAGGSATIRALAHGTEIALSVPRSDILEETAPTGRTQ